MKTSIFDMNLTLPPVVVMTEVMKDMPSGTGGHNGSGAHCWPNC